MRTTALLAVVLVGAGCADRIERYEGTLSECDERSAQDTGSNDGARTSLIIDRVEDPPLVLFAISNTLAGPGVATEFRPAIVEETATDMIFSGTAGIAPNLRDYTGDLSAVEGGYDGGFLVVDGDAAAGTSPEIDCRVTVQRVDQ